MAMDILIQILMEPLMWEAEMAPKLMNTTSGERLMVYWCLLVLFVQFHVIFVLVHSLATDST